MNPAQNGARGEKAKICRIVSAKLERHVQRNNSREQTLSQHAWCTVCCRDIKVAASGVYEHIKQKLHERQLHCGQVTNFVKPRPADSADSTTKAEVIFSYFVVEHNFPALLADHFTDLACQMFPDSDITKRFRCKRTKTTQIVKRCLAPAATTPVVERRRAGPFSLMVDESTDRKTDKRLVVLVR